MKIGFVFQTFNLLPHLNILKNVELPLMYAGLSPKQRYKQAVDLLSRLGLGDRLHHRPSELSGGQRQRVAIARAVINNPAIILADEPTGNLDSQSGSDILSIFRELHQNNNTIIMVTHDQNIAKIADRTIMIKDGELLMAISLKESIQVGFQDFWSRKLRSLVTIVGIILGTMSIIVILSLVSGMNEQTMKWMSERGGLTKITVQKNWDYKNTENLPEYFSLKEVTLIKSLVPEAAAFNAAIYDRSHLKNGSNDTYYASAVHL
jgi:energy-coupling factor transporter ATP-binding protein EcfA2